MILRQATAAASGDAAKPSPDLAVSLALQVLQQVGHGSATNCQVNQNSPSPDPAGRTPGALPSTSEPAQHDTLLLPPSPVMNSPLPTDVSSREARRGEGPPSLNAGAHTLAGIHASSPAQGHQSVPQSSDTPSPRSSYPAPAALPNSSPPQGDMGRPHGVSHYSKPCAPQVRTAQVATTGCSVPSAGGCPGCTPRVKHTCCGGNCPPAGECAAGPRLPFRKPAIGVRRMDPPDTCLIPTQSPTCAPSGTSPRQHPHTAGQDLRSYSPGGCQEALGHCTHQGAKVMGHRPSPDQTGTRERLPHQASPKKCPREGADLSGHVATHCSATRSTVHTREEDTASVPPVSHQWSARGEVTHCAAGKASKGEGPGGNASQPVPQGQGQSRMAPHMPIGDFDPCLMDLVAEVESITGHGPGPGVAGRKHREERVCARSPVRPARGRTGHPRVAQWVRHSAMGKVTHPPPLTSLSLPRAQHPGAKSLCPTRVWRSSAVNMWR